MNKTITMEGMLEKYKDFHHIGIISDLHIDDYSYMNTTPHFRLSQYLPLAKTIVKKCERLNITKLLFAGDTLNSSVTPPIVIVYLRAFLTIIHKAGIWTGWLEGQHDGDTRILNGKDTYLRVLENFEYMNEKSFDFYGFKFYVENFQRGVPVVVAKQECDVYVSHITLTFGQSADESRFKLGVFGDIHDWVDKGKSHSIGTPMQNQPSEPQDGVMGIVSVREGEEPVFNRLLLDEDRDTFLRMEPRVKSFSENEQGIDEQAVQEILDKKNFKASLYNLAVKHNVLDIHNMIDLNNLPVLPSLDFKVKKLYFQDFKLAHKVELLFDELGKVIYLKGDNGVGKSTIMEAMYAALLGGTWVSDNQTIIENSRVMVGIILTYAGAEYEITRYKSGTDFRMNGEKIERHLLKDLNADIRRQLPFINVIDKFYINNHNNFFDQDRVSLINSCFNLGGYDYLRESAFTIFKQKKREVANLKSDLLYKKGQNDSLSTSIANLKEDLKDYEFIQSTEEIQKKLTEGRRLESMKTTNQGTLNELTRRGALLYKQIVDSKGISMSELEEEENNYKKMVELKSEKSMQERSLKASNSLLTTVATCPKCSNTFFITDLDGSVKKRRDELVISIAELQADITKLQTLITRDMTTVAQLKHVVEVRESNLVELKDVSVQVTSMKAQIADLELKLLDYDTDKLTKVMMKSAAKQVILDTLGTHEASKRDLGTKSLEVHKKWKEASVLLQHSELYMNLFDLKNLESVPYKELTRVSGYLSNERLTFKTFKELNNGNEKLDISCTIDVNGNGVWVSYDRASEGQKVYMDLFILERLLEVVGPIGFICIDESLSVVQPNRYDESCRQVQELKAHTIFITSHQLGFNYGDSEISCALNSEGRSSYGF